MKPGEIANQVLGARRWRRPRRRAVVLILVLWIATVLSLLAYSVMYQLTLESKITSSRKQKIEAESLVRAAIAKAFVDLQNDLIFDQADDDDPPFDAEGDVWTQQDIDDEGVQLEYGGYEPGSFWVTVEDEERLFNLNRLGSNSKLLLKTIIEDIGYEEEDAELVAAAIIDYGDRDDVPALDSAPAGGEGLAWGIIRAERNNQSTRESDVERMDFPNEGYMTVDALLDVYGVTPELFFGPGSPEAARYREAMGDSLDDGGFSIRERRTFRAGDRPLGLRDYFTVESSARLNLNTAPRHVLAALFRAAGRDDGDRLAERIIRDRRGGRDRNIDNDRAFKQTQDFQNNADLASILGPASALYALGVNSTTFRITARARVGGAEVERVLVVHRSMTVVQRQEDFEAIDRAQEREDRLGAKRDRRTDSDNELLVRIPSIRILRWLKV